MRKMRKVSALLLAAVMAAGGLTGYMPAYAKEIAEKGEETAKTVELPRCG